MRSVDVHFAKQFLVSPMVNPFRLKYTNPAMPAAKTSCTSQAMTLVLVHITLFCKYIFDYINVIFFVKAKPFQQHEDSYIYVSQAVPYRCFYYHMEYDSNEQKAKVKLTACNIPIFIKCQIVLYSGGWTEDIKKYTLAPAILNSARENP